MTGAEIALAFLAIGTGVSAIGQVQAGNAAKRFARIARKQEGERIVGGASLDLLEDNAMEEKLEELGFIHAAEISAIGFETDAAIARAGGRTAQRAGYVGAGSDLLLGGSKAAGKFEGPITDLKLSA